MTDMARLPASVVVLLVAVAGCSAEPPEPPSSPSGSVPLEVRTVADTGGLDERLRRRLEGEVGEVLSEYVVNAFLGEFPRQGFVRSFDAFTSGAASYAAGDIEILTAAELADARSVRATALDAGLSFMIHRGDVLGASADVRFRFEATLESGDVVPLRLRGRFTLREDDGTWSVFAYDVDRDDGPATEEGASQ